MAYFSEGMVVGAKGAERRSEAFWGAAQDSFLKRTHDFILIFESFGIRDLGSWT